MNDNSKSFQLLTLTYFISLNRNNNEYLLLQLSLPKKKKVRKPYYIILYSLSIFFPESLKKRYEAMITYYD